MRWMWCGEVEPSPDLEAVLINTAELRSAFDGKQTSAHGAALAKETGARQLPRKLSVDKVASLRWVDWLT